jgi:hypothetical protein
LLNRHVRQDIRVPVLRPARRVPRVTAPQPQIAFVLSCCGPQRLPAKRAEPPPPYCERREAVGGHALNSFPVTLTNVCNIAELATAKLKYKAEGADGRHSSCGTDQS